VCYHEASHAVIAEFLGIPWSSAYAAPSGEDVVDPNGDKLSGYVQLELGQIPKPDHPLPPNATRSAIAGLFIGIIYFAGRVGELMAERKPVPKTYIASWTSDDAVAQQSCRRAMPHDPDTLLDMSWSLAHGLLKVHWPIVTEAARGMKMLGIVDQHDVAQMMSHCRGLPEMRMQ
jgi:hypothetical protein